MMSAKDEDELDEGDSISKLKAKLQGGVDESRQATPEKDEKESRVTLVHVREDAVITANSEVRSSNSVLVGVGKPEVVPDGAEGSLEVTSSKLDDRSAQGGTLRQGAAVGGAQSEKMVRKAMKQATRPLERRIKELTDLVNSMQDKLTSQKNNIRASGKLTDNENSEIERRVQAEIDKRLSQFSPIPQPASMRHIDSMYSIMNSSMRSPSPGFGQYSTQQDFSPPPLLKATSTATMSDDEVAREFQRAMIERESQMSGMNVPGHGGGLFTQGSGVLASSVHGMHAHSPNRVAGMSPIPFSSPSLRGGTSVKAKVESGIVDLSASGSALQDSDMLDVIDNSPEGIWQVNIAGCVNVQSSALQQLGRLGETLTHLNLYKSAGVTDDVVSILSGDCPLLTHVQFSHCWRLTDKGVSVMAESCPQLIVVDLSGCSKVGNGSLKALGDHCTALKELGMSMCSAVTDKGLSSLSPCKELSNVDFSHCRQVSDVGISVLANACPRLSTLQLTACSELSDASLQELSQHCPDLTSLNMSYCSKVTDAGLRYLSQGCMALEEVIIFGCRFVSQEGISALQAMCLNLRSVDYRNCSGISKFKSEREKKKMESWKRD
uniref:F-box/LRR-repeat protein 15-like leucin rich repeat domain-containing protein n=1 Tax=Palpitomonas bilix TaxID=652834 RepID=A0A7S3DCF7_9EUKA